MESVLSEDRTIIYHAFGFRKDMENLYSAADLVVSRAGATTIAELSCFGLPAIFVPYPFAGGHQKENARVLVDSGGARHVPDELVGEKLKGEVEALLEDKSTLEDMSHNSRLTAKPEASKHVVDVCRSVIK